MTGADNLPQVFAGITEPEYSDFDKAGVVIFPVSYGSETGNGAKKIINASRFLERYDEETDSEVYRTGIHTLEEFKPRETPEKMMKALYEYAKELLNSDKFICTIGGEHSISAPVIRAHAEKFHDLSVLQIDARADLRAEHEETPHSHASVMARVVRDHRIPAVQVGIRSISAEEAIAVSEGLPTKIYRAKDIVGRTDWIDDAIENLTDNVYLTIDVSGLDPSIMPTVRTPEPGGLGWYEALRLIRKLAAKKRIVGMDLVEYVYVESVNAPTFLCAKLVYKSLSYIFKQETARIVGTG